MKAVIFDFSGTLFRCEQTTTWLTTTLDEAGIQASDEEIAHYATRLQASGGQPGGYTEFPVPDHLRSLWDRRDLDPADHRAVYTELMRLAGLPWPVEDLLYDRHWRPDMWHPYPDTRAALESLKRRGVPVAVLSNIAADVRPVFWHHGLEDLVAAYVFSYQHGVQKPDPEIFRIACDLLGHAPEDVRMVGDNVTADGAAVQLGCEFRAVSHLPVAERPRALVDAVS